MMPVRHICRRCVLEHRDFWRKKPHLMVEDEPAEKFFNTVLSIIDNDDVMYRCPVWIAQHSNQNEVIPEKCRYQVELLMEGHPC